MKSINFRQDPFNSFIRLSNIIITPVSIIMLGWLCSLVVMVFLLTKGLSLLTDKAGKNLELWMGSAGDINIYKAYGDQLLNSELGLSQMLLIGFLLLYLLLTAWLINVLLVIAKGKLNSEQALLWSAVSGSFSRTWLHTFAVMGILAASFAIYTLLTRFVFSIPVVDHQLFKVQTLSPFLSESIRFILWIPVFALIAFRLLASFSAISIGQLGLKKALAYSWKRISWRRSGVLMAALGIGYLLYQLLIYAMTGMIDLVDLNTGIYFDLILTTVVKYPVYIIFYSLLSAGLTLLYFRYREDMTFNVEEHLVSEHERTNL